MFKCQSRVEQQNHAVDIKATIRECLRDEMCTLKSEVKKDLTEFKLGLNVTLKQKLDQLDHYQRHELSELKSHVIHSTSDNNQLIDRLKVIDRANDASRERLRNLKEDMINLNVKVDNITEKLIMDRLGLMDGESSGGGGVGGSNHTDEKKFKKIEEDLDKIKFYTVKNYRLLDGAGQLHNQQQQDTTPERGRGTSHRPRHNNHTSRSRSPPIKRSKHSASTSRRQSPSRGGAHSRLHHHR